MNSILIITNYTTAPFKTLYKKENALPTVMVSRAFLYGRILTDVVE